MTSRLIRATTLLLCGLLPAPALLAADYSDIIARVKPGVVALADYQPLRQPAVIFRSSAFVVADGRHAITNAHSVPAFLDPEKKEQVVIVVPQGERHEVRMAQVVARDPDHDLALLKFSDAPLPPLQLGDDAQVKEGQEFLLSGFPVGSALGYHVVTHKAMIAAITPAVQPVYNSKQLDPALLKRMRAARYAAFQLDAIAYPGSSGSPLYDPESGAVVGVLNSVFVKDTKESSLENPSGIAYAIPVKFVKRLLREAGLAGAGE